MKPKEGVVEFLNRVLKSELTVVHQYFHAAMRKNWGYECLHEHFSHLIDHILRTIDQVENFLTEQVKGAEA